MWIKLDFTPLFVAGLIVGLVLLAIGFSLRAGFPSRPAIGIVVMVIGAIPALLCGFALVADSVGDWYKKNRSVTEVLPADRDLLGIVWPRGSEIGFIDKLMWSAMPGQPVLVQGIPLEGQIIFRNVSGRWGVALNAYVERAEMGDDHLVDGVPCKAHYPVEFYPVPAPRASTGQPLKAEVGRLKSCSAATDFELAGVRYQGDAAITLDAKGSIDQGILAADQDVDGHWCRKGSKLERSDNRATHFTLARDETIGGVACKAGGEVMLAPSDGHVISAVLAGDQEWNGIPCRGGGDVAFDYTSPAQKLDGCILSRPVTLVNAEWPAGSKLEGLAGMFLGITLPAGAPPVQVGEIRVVGRCKMTFDNQTKTLSQVRVVSGEAGYAEIRGARFNSLQMSELSIAGSIQEAATVDGVAHSAGEFVYLKNSAPR